MTGHDVHNQCVDRSCEKWFAWRGVGKGQFFTEDRIVQPPYQGVPALNQKTQAIQTGPGAAHSGLLFEMLLVDLGLAIHQEIPPEEVPEDQGPEGQRELVSVPGGMLAVPQTVGTKGVWPCWEDMDRRFLPTLIGRWKILNEKTVRRIQSVRK